MRVRFAGLGDAFGSGGRWQTCIHLAAEGQVLLVDCGAPPLALRVERVVLTHMPAAMLAKAELPAAYDGMVIDL
jgi:hypothetical protein